MNAQIEKYIDDHFQEMLEDLSEFVAIPSVSSDHENVVKALRHVLALADKYGFNTQSVLDEQVGIIEMGEGDETLGILTHVDVVPPGDREDWDSDPFTTVIKDNRIYGRGTLDDKGMVISSIYAMRAVKDLGLPIRKKVQLIMGTQEEVEWVDMDQFVKEYPLPDYGYTPDGEYPICNIEKGTVDQTLEFDVREDKEPEGVYLKKLDIGIANNVVPGKAKAVLSNGEEILAIGKSVHSCQPERGDNAIFRLKEMLDEKGLAPSKLGELLNAVARDLSDPFGSKVGLYSADEYYMGEFVHRNAFSPTIFKAENGRAILNINVRFPYGEEPANIIKHFEDWAAPLNGKTLRESSLPAVFVSKERPFLKVFANAYEDVSGLENEFTLAYGGSYAKAMPNVVSWAPLFPGEEDTCHEPNEFIDLDSLLKSTKIFGESIMQIALTEESFK
ncbi:MAG: Sapep family Mn(2+)-dependent dipeptidase [Clostridia bacterium]|nr:Sapep family Mn(2+)-dependent dipeptidase [Clostridia bacterium]